MDINALVNKVCDDIKKAPQLFDGLKGIVIANIKDISEIKTEEEFYDFVTKLGDRLIELKGVLELLDGPAIKLLLKKVIDPILDKKAGKDWFEKFQAWLKSLTD